MRTPSVEQIRKALEEVSNFHPYPVFEERDRWEALSEDRYLRMILESIVKEAEAMLKNPLPHAFATDYLSFIRTGIRSQWDGVFRQHRNYFDTLVLAECIEGEGRFLDGILDSAWALCELSTWCPPQHAPGQTLPEPGYHQIDLIASHMASDAALSLYLMGERMDGFEPRWKERILYELDRRIWKPYLERDDHWWLKPGGDREILNNWTAVCNNGVVSSAIFCMDDLDRLSEIIHRGIWSLGFYLDSFTEDGGSSEGVSYWNYGFGNYVELRDILYRRTDGAIDLFDDVRIPEIAEFPLKFVLSGDRCVNFSDCGDIFRPFPWLCSYLWRQFGIEDFGRLANALIRSIPENVLGYRNFSLALKTFFDLPRDLPSGPLRHSAHYFLQSLQWMISRFDPSDEGTLILAVKGGHNGENHNQNDCGSFIIHFMEESLVAELGSGSYTRAYFGPDRYRHIACSSRGHSVPLVNDVEQGTGKSYGAEILSHGSTESQDILSLDLKGAYPEEAGLDKLDRTISLVREGDQGFVELVDEVVFSSGDRCDFMMPVYSFHPMEFLKPGSALIVGEKGSLRVEYDIELVKAEYEKIATDDDKLRRLSKADGKISRLVFRFKKQEKSGRLVLRFIPYAIWY